MNPYNKDKQYILPVFDKYNINFIKGEKSFLYADTGKKYLDFCSGVASNSLGHCNPKLVKALKKQLNSFMHISNLYPNKNQSDLAELISTKIIKHPGKVFFSNSGSEANEAALKIARRFGNLKNKIKESSEIITFSGSFHGRTFANISATNLLHPRQGFSPLLPGFIKAEFNNIQDLKSKITKYTSAIMIEAVQGVNGIQIANKEFLLELVDICKENNILFFLDDVQAGLGRAGSLISIHSILDDLKIIPDIITFAKGIGGGFPLAATWVKERNVYDKHLTDILTTGSHASTFGGNPLASIAGITVLNQIINKKLSKNSQKMGKILAKKLRNLNSELIKEVRQIGLFIAIEFDDSKFKELFNTKKDSLSYFYNQFLENGLLTVKSKNNSLNLLPPLNIGKSEVNLALKIIKNSLYN